MSIREIRTFGYSDTELLDFLEEQGAFFGFGWIARESDTGRGYRLHQTTRDGGKPTAREAIVDAMRSA